MNKIIRDGKVAVLVSSLGHGAGWSTWNRYAELVFDVKIVEAVEAGKPLSEVDAYLKTCYENIYLGGYCDLTVQWVNIGEKFKISEYDGLEAISILDEDDYYTA